MNPTAFPTVDPSLLRRARGRVALKTGWLVHALVFAVVNGALFAVSLATQGARGGGFPLWGWALGLGIHGTVVLGLLASDGWRKRMLERELASLQR